nr:hypothetical protein [Tanacetum cinerariifolium]
PHRGGCGESANHSPTTAAAAAGKAAVVAAVVVRWLSSGGGVGCGAAVVLAAVRQRRCGGAGCRKAAAVGMVTGGSGVLMVAVGGLDRSVLSQVMSTPSYVDSESITQADGAQSSRVPIPLSDDPYVDEWQSVGSRVPLLGENFKAVESSGTRTYSSYSSVSLDFTASWSPSHLLTYVSPTPTPTRALFHRRIARVTRYRSSYETPLPSLTLLVRKRYRGTSELILDTNSEGDELGDEDIDKDEEDESLDADDERDRLDDEDRGLDDEDRSLYNEDRGLDDEDRSLDDEVVGEPLGLGYRALRHRELAVDEDQVFSTFEPTLGTWVDPEDGMIYTDIPAYAPPVPPIQTPPSPEWLFDSLHISPSFPVAPSPIASPVATLTATISIDEDQFLEVGAQLELHGSILYDHTQHLDTLPPTLFADIDRDERIDVTFEALWRSMLTLEAYVGHVDTRLTDTSWDRYNDHKLIHDMLVQQATMQREL